MALLSNIFHGLYFYSFNQMYKMKMQEHMIILCLLNY